MRNRVAQICIATVLNILQMSSGEALDELLWLLPTTFYHTCEKRHASPRGRICLRADQAQWDQFVTANLSEDASKPTFSLIV